MSMTLKELFALPDSEIKDYTAWVHERVGACSPDPGDLTDLEKQERDYNIAFYKILRRKRK